MVKKTLGEQIDLSLREIESAIWEHEITPGTKPDYSNDAFRAASKIFMSVMMDKLYDLQEKEGIEMEDRERMAFSLGLALKDLVKTYTDIDTIKLYKEF